MSETKEQSNFLEAKTLTKPESSRLEQLEQENASLTKENEQLKRRLHEALVDKTTGLLKREQFFITVRHDMEHYAGDLIDQLEDADNDAEIQAVLAEFSKRNIPLHLAMGDVSYLKLGNKIDHTGGDALLRNLGKAAQVTGSPKPDTASLDPANTADAPFIAFRHGGDEVSAVIRTASDQEAEQWGADFEYKFATGENIDEFKQYTLRPRVDIGVANLAEATSAFQKVLKNNQTILREERFKKLVDTWIQIADRRSNLEKGLARISELMRIKRENPKLYQECVGFIRRGALDITNEEIDELNKEWSTGKLDWRTTAANYIISKTEQDLASYQEEKARHHRIIAEVADTPSLDSYFRKSLVQ